MKVSELINIKSTQDIMTSCVHAEDWKDRQKALDEFIKILLREEAKNDLLKILNSGERI